MNEGGKVEGHKPFVENTVDFSTTREFVSVDECWSWTFDGPLEVRLKLLNHPEKENMGISKLRHGDDG